jgi:Family of unknown function (DUF6186)
MGRTLIIAAYLALALAAVTVELVAQREGSTLPSIGDVVSKLSARRAGRITVAVGWWWLGWHFFVR